MAQSKQQIQQWLAQAGGSPRHRFGQNFMIDQNLVRLVAEAGELGAQDVAIEVGPGTGTLTEELLPRAGHVVAVEIDRALARLLRERFAEEGRFRLIEGDALAGKHALNEELRAVIREAQARGAGVKLVANLPYNIASPLVIGLLSAGVELLAFTVQKEVGERLRAEAASEEYGPLSVMAQLLAEVELLRTLPPQAFWPAPKVESVLVRLRRRDQLAHRAEPFRLFLQALFAARRKTLRRALNQAGHANADTVLSEMGLSGQERPEVLTPAQFLAMFERLSRGTGVSPVS